MNRVRRSREEIDAGMTISQKKQGMTIKDIQCSDTKKTIPTPKPKQIIKEVIKEVVKEVRVYNNQTDTEMTIQEMVRQELNKCKWEWKEMKMSECRLSTFKALGKQGWKLAYIMEWKGLKSTWADKEDSFFFQRPSR